MISTNKSWVKSSIPVEEYVGLTVYDLTYFHLGDVLVVKLVPLVIEVVQAVGRVVSTCQKKNR